MSRRFSPTSRRATRQTSYAIETHLPCSECGSSDALSKYSDGHSHCFACGDHKKELDKSSKSVYNILKDSEGETIAQINNNNNKGSRLDMTNYVETDAPSWRGIDQSSFKHYGVKCRVSSHGTPMALVIPWGGGSKQIRELAEKRFYMEGHSEGSLPLFGMDKFPAASASAITITEGALDAISAFQMLGSKYPVVSVRSASSARGDAQKAFEYLNSFEKIYLCMDRDEPGEKASKAVASLFNPNKVFIVPLSPPYKDANDYLTDGKTKEYIKAWWASKKHRPKGIVESFEDIKGILESRDSAPIASWPFPTLQEMTYGIRSQEVNLITAQEKVGKGLLLGTLHPTPTGWVKTEDIKVGTQLFSVDGQVTTVTYVTPVQKRLSYRVTFSDGTYLDAWDEHRWSVRDLQGRVHVRTTKELLDRPTIMPGSKASWMVPQHPGVVLPEQPVSIHPFLLGVWLADGSVSKRSMTLSLEKRDKVLAKGFHIFSEFENSPGSVTVSFKELTVENLRSYGVLDSKRIPDVYLRGSIHQRRDLFEGLMFDGWRGAGSKQQNEYYSSNKELFDQVVELARSLGYIVSVRQRQGKYKKGDEWVTAKVAYSFRWRRADWKAIRSIQPIGEQEGACLTVDHPSHLYLAGDGWTTTHNTAFMSAIEHHLIKTTDHAVGIIHLEQAEKRTIQGILNYELGVATHLPDSGVSNDDLIKSYSTLVRTEGRVHFYKHFGSDDPDSILDVIRYLVAVCGCKFIFLDHITMLVTGFEGDDERRKLDYISTRLAMLTRELDFTLFLVSHLNDNNQTRGSRNISKTADLLLRLERDIEAESYELRNTTKLTVFGQRDIAASGPAGYLWFDSKSYTVHEKKVEDALIVDQEEPF